MVSHSWSWIFIIQFFMIRPGYAHVSQNFDVIFARHVVEDVLARSLSKVEKARNTFAALAIAGSVVLFAGLLGLYLVIRKQRLQAQTQDLESASVERPNWWMVEGKDEKMDRWRLSLQLQDASHVESEPAHRYSGLYRLKAALQRKAAKDQPILPIHSKTETSPTETIDLPMQTVPAVQPMYPDILEKGFNAPIYTANTPPQIPLLTRTLDENNRVVKRSPPGIAIYSGLAHSTLTRSGAERRAGAPRSPANKRRSWLTRHQFRHPFLPLKATDAPMLVISAPMPADISQLTHPKLAHALSMSKPRPAPIPPTGPRSSLKPPVPSKVGLRPAPLKLDNVVSPRRVRFGLPHSPRPDRV